MAAPKVYLTKKQRAVVDYVEQYGAEKGEAPTLREIAQHFGISKVSVLQHLRALEKKKVLKRMPYAARSIDVRPEFVTRARLPRVEIPCVGTISAGAPMEPFPSPQGVDVASLFETRKECVLLRAKGDSMKDDAIRDGDYVIVERRDWARDGEMVVAVLPSGEATLKRLYREEGGVRLQPSNPDQAPLQVPSAKVYGVVIGLLRRLAT